MPELLAMSPRMETEPPPNVGGEIVGTALDRETAAAAFDLAIAIYKQTVSVAVTTAAHE